MCVNLNVYRTRRKLSGFWSCTKGKGQKVSTHWTLTRDCSRLMQTRHNHPGVPCSADNQPSATKYESRSIFQEANSLTSFLSKFCYISLYVTQNAKQAKIRSWGAIVCGEKSERRCHKEGFRGELPAAPSWAVSDSSMGKNIRRGGWRQEADGLPNYCTSRDPCGIFLVPKKCSDLLFWNISLFIKIHS